MKKRTRRALRALIWLAWCVLVLEVGAFLVMWGTTGSRPGYWRQRDRQGEVAGWEPRGGWSAERERLLNELGIAQADWQRTEVRHPYLGYVGAPRGRQMAPTGSTMHGLGLGDRTSWPFRKDVFVVGISGGSVAAGISSHATDLIRERLLAHPTLAGKEVHVFSFAAAGHKQPQQLLALAYGQSLGVELDAVINLDGFNDVALYDAEHAATRLFPAYPRNWAQRVALGDEDAALGGRIGLLEEARADAALAMLASPLRWSWVRQLVWTRTDAALESRRAAALAELEGRLRGNAEDDLAQFERRGPPAGIHTWEDAIPELARVWERSSRAMARMCDSIGALYVHAIQPNQYDTAHRKPMSDAERAVAFHPASHFNASVPAGYPLLREGAERLRAEGIVVLDLTGLFDSTDAPMYVDDCCHFNALGYQRIAEQLVEALLSQM